MYSPDKWLILKITNDKETIYKVLAGWSGSYLEGQSWKINSGIDNISEDGDYYLFEGYSGSIYQCHKKAYGANMIMSGILNTIESQQNDYTVEVLPNQDFTILLKKK